MRTATIVVVLLVMLSGPGFGQGKGPDVTKYLEMVRDGKVEEVRKEIPALLSEYPNDPGVLYLQAMVTADGAESVRIYQSIVDNFPKSEYADDALYHVYQYYYALGLYRTAQMKLEQLRKDYPDSKYIRTATDTTVQTLAEEKRADTVSPVPQAVRPAEPAGQFTLQVGAYTAQVNAEKQKLFFEDLGFPVEVVSKIRGNRSLFLVLVGTFPSYEQAKAQGTAFRQKYNIESLVIAK